MIEASQAHKLQLSAIIAERGEEWSVRRLCPERGFYIRWAYQLYHFRKKNLRPTTVVDWFVRWQRSLLRQPPASSLAISEMKTGRGTGGPSDLGKRQ